MDAARMAKALAFLARVNDLCYIDSIHGVPFPEEARITPRTVHCKNLVSMRQGSQD